MVRTMGMNIAVVVLGLGSTYTCLSKGFLAWCSFSGSILVVLAKAIVKNILLNSSKFAKFPNLLHR